MQRNKAYENHIIDMNTQFVENGIVVDYVDVDLRRRQRICATYADYLLLVNSLVDKFYQPKS